MLFAPFAGIRWVILPPNVHLGKQWEIEIFLWWSTKERFWNTKYQVIRSIANIGNPQFHYFWEELICETNTDCGNFDQEISLLYCIKFNFFACPSASNFVKVSSADYIRGNPLYERSTISRSALLLFIIGSNKERRQLCLTSSHNHLWSLLLSLSSISLMIFDNYIISSSLWQIMNVLITYHYSFLYIRQNPLKFFQEGMILVYMWSICQYENREFGKSSFSGRTSFEGSSLNEFQRKQSIFFRWDG